LLNLDDELVRRHGDDGDHNADANAPTWSATAGPAQRGLGVERDRPFLGDRGLLRHIRPPLDEMLSQPGLVLGELRPAPDCESQLGSLAV